jgi:hypothetical protein
MSGDDWDWQPPKRWEPREPHPDTVVEPNPSAPLARNEEDPEWSDDDRMVADHEEYLRFLRDIRSAWGLVLQRRNRKT